MTSPSRTGLPRSGKGTICASIGSESSRYLRVWLMLGDLQVSHLGSGRRRVLADGPPPALSFRGIGWLVVVELVEQVGVVEADRCSVAVLGAVQAAGGDREHEALVFASRPVAVRHVVF